jgi:hypothetical protein
MSGFNHLNQIGAEMRGALSRELDEAILAIATEAKLSMRESKSGRVYGKHQASAPGEAPAIDTSALVNSIDVAAPGEFVRVVGTNQEQGAALEFGRADGHFSERPFLRPAAKKMFGQIVKRLTDALGKFQ